MMGLEQANAIRERYLDREAPHIDSEYMIVTPRRKLPKTWVYLVSSKNHGSTLGHILWFAHWRQYAFQPETDTTFSKGCLNDISTFIQMLMDERSRLSKEVRTVEP